MGVWIEIINPGGGNPGGKVTPFVGVWIEILNRLLLYVLPMVTPFVGVWIEISVNTVASSAISCHSLRGSSSTKALAREI